MNIQTVLTNKINHALLAAGIANEFKLQIKQSTKLKFGDYQINGIITLAKKLGISPNNLAKRILTYLNLDGIATKIEIVNPGFINVFLDPNFLAININKLLKSNRLGIIQPKMKTIVVDYSSPNIAKEMHVGHLRSTIIGDAMVRTLEFLGHKVIRANHIGDWGTQFGMLIAYLETKEQNNTDKINLSDLESFYREAKKCFNKDKDFAEKARKYVVKLQRGDAFFIKKWRQLVNISISKNQIIYDRLNVKLTVNDVMGESVYNSLLPFIVKDLKDKGLAVENNGALVVFLKEFKNKKGEPMGVVIQKRDGGYLYTTTDIACVKYRYETLHADRIIYYTDSRQHQHLIQAWMIARKAGYVPDHVKIEHHMFGMMLNKDSKPFKTSKGKNVRLSDLIDESLNRARNLIIKKNPKIPIERLNKLTNVIGIGALKYADLSKNRTTNYIFDWDKILEFEGNTSPYMQYAYARIISIMRKSNTDENQLNDFQIIIDKAAEINLVKKLLQFEETICIVARDGTPHIMCSYLYNLAGIFSTFYEKHSILHNNNIIKRNSRLKLSLLTAKTLKIGLNILGIETIDRM